MAEEVIGIGSAANDGTGDPGRVAFTKVNDNFADLYAARGGYSTTIPCSGDTSGSQDFIALSVALVLLASSAATPPGSSSKVLFGEIVWGPGVVNIARTIPLPSTQKTIGLRMRGQGRNQTVFNFNPPTSQPMFVNQFCLALDFSDFTATSQDPASDFIWNQEQAGVSNIQEQTLDIAVNGFRWVDRRTGGNNNSEARYINNTYNNIQKGVLYTPPPATCSMSASSSTVSITNAGVGDVQVGDTGSFSAAVAPLSAGTSYYVVAANPAASPPTFQVSLTRGGSPVTFTASGTPTFTNASDQFLNFHWEGITKFWSAKGGFMTLNFGGGVTIDHLDASAFTPISPCAFVGSCSGTTLTIASITSGALVPGHVLEGGFGTPILPGTQIVALLTGSGGAGSTYQISISQTIAASTPMFVPVYLFAIPQQSHSGGVMDFKISHLRVEYANDVGRGGYFKWVSGALDIDDVNESSQSGSRHATNINWLYDITNNTGPVIRFTGSQLAGQHAWVTNSNNFNFNQSMHYDGILLLNQPDVANFALWTDVSNSGGAPIVHFDNISQPSTASGGAKRILDCTWNWSQGDGAIAKILHANLVGAQGQLPVSGAAFSYEFPKNALMPGIRVVKPANGNTGAYSYSIQTTEATPTVLGTFSGANAGAAISLYLTAAPLAFQMGSDTTRTIQIVDTASRSGVFLGCIVDVEYIGG